MINTEKAGKANSSISATVFFPLFILSPSKITATRNNTPIVVLVILLAINHELRIDIIPKIKKSFDVVLLQAIHEIMHRYKTEDA